MPDRVLRCGCRGFNGPFPLPLWMSGVQLSGHCRSRRTTVRPQVREVRQYGGARAPRRPADDEPRQPLDTARPAPRPRPRDPSAGRWRRAGPRERLPAPGSDGPGVHRRQRHRAAARRGGAGPPADAARARGPARDPVRLLLRRRHAAAVPGGGGLVLGVHTGLLLLQRVRAPGGSRRRWLPARAAAAHPSGSRSDRGSPTAGCLAVVARGKVGVMPDTAGPGQAQLLVASNRGPLSFTESSGGVLQASRGGGGLVSGLMSMESGTAAVWVCAALTEGDRLAARRAENGRLDLDGHDTGGAAVRMLDIDP